MLLVYTVSEHPACQNSSKENNVFDGEEAAFSAYYYLDRIVRYSGASPCCLIAGFLYLERLKAKPAFLVLTPRNLQRLVLVAVMTATKFLEDTDSFLLHW